MVPANPPSPKATACAAPQRPMRVPSRPERPCAASIIIEAMAAAGLRTVRGTGWHPNEVKRVLERLLAEQLPAWVQVSGGTNDLTGRLAQTRGVAIHGVGMGTFARKFIALNPSDALTPETLSQCIDRARTLVHSVTPNLAALK